MVEPVGAESPVVELVMLEPALMVVELGVVAAEEPPMVTKDMGLVVPELPEPVVLLEGMGERYVLLGVNESGGGRRTRQGQHQPCEKHSCPYRMFQPAACHRPLSSCLISCLIAQPVIPEASCDRSSIETFPAPPVFHTPSGARHTACNINGLEAERGVKAGRHMTMYCVVCYFCSQEVVSPFWDEIQEHLDSCFYDLTPEEQGRVGYANEVPSHSVPHEMTELWDECGPAQPGAARVVELEARRAG